MRQKTLETKISSVNYLIIIRRYCLSVKMKLKCWESKPKTASNQDYGLFIFDGCSNAPSGGGSFAADSTFLSSKSSNGL